MGFNKQSWRENVIRMKIESFIFFLLLIFLLLLIFFCYPILFLRFAKDRWRKDEEGEKEKKKEEEQAKIKGLFFFLFIYYYYFFLNVFFLLSIKESRSRGNAAGVRRIYEAIAELILIGKLKGSKGKKEERKKKNRKQIRGKIKIRRRSNRLELLFFFFWFLLLFLFFFEVSLFGERLKVKWTYRTKCCCCCFDVAATEERWSDLTEFYRVVSLLLLFVCVCVCVGTGIGCILFFYVLFLWRNHWFFHFQDGPKQCVRDAGFLWLARFFEKKRKEKSSRRWKNVSARVHSKEDLEISFFFSRVLL